MSWQSKSETVFPFSSSSSSSLLVGGEQELSVAAGKEAPRWRRSQEGRGLGWGVVGF